MPKPPTIYPSTKSSPYSSPAKKVPSKFSQICLTVKLNRVLSSGINPKTVIPDSSNLGITTSQASVPLYIVKKFSTAPIKFSPKAVINGIASTTPLYLPTYITFASMDLISSICWVADNLLEASNIRVSTPFSITLIFAIASSFNSIDSLEELFRKESKTMA